MSLPGQTKSELLRIVKEGSLEEQFDSYLKLLDYYDYNNQDSSLISSLNLVRIAHDIQDYDMLAESIKC